MNEVRRASDGEGALAGVARRPSVRSRSTAMIGEFLGDEIAGQCGDRKNDDDAEQQSERGQHVDTSRAGGVRDDHEWVDGSSRFARRAIDGPLCVGVTGLQT